MASKTNLFIDQGSNTIFQIYLTDDADMPIPLGGVSVTSQIRKQYSSTNAVSFTCDVDPQNGLIELSLTALETANLSMGRYVYDIDLVDAADSRLRLFEGILTVSPGVTR